MKNSVMTPAQFADKFQHFGELDAPFNDTFEKEGQQLMLSLCRDINMLAPHTTTAQRRLLEHIISGEEDTINCRKCFLKAAELLDKTMFSRFFNQLLTGEGVEDNS